VIGFGRYVESNGGIMYKKDKNMGGGKDLMGKRVQYPGAAGAGGIGMGKRMIEGDGGRFEEGEMRGVNDSFYDSDGVLSDKADGGTLILENFEIVEGRNEGVNVDYFGVKNYNVGDFCEVILIT
ncbi:ABC transporter substrate-binding protein, partial [Staphylococcus epidermidis]|uniref:ABC transporter substrate-binding protein n=1 Tax=Staphylococcus epidermidis TaxID=1282 RepID=UPI0011A31729